MLIKGDTRSLDYSSIGLHIMPLVLELLSPLGSSWGILDSACSLVFTSVGSVVSFSLYIPTLDRYSRNASPFKATTLQSHPSNGPTRKSTLRALVCNYGKLFQTQRVQIHN